MSEVTVIGNALHRGSGSAFEKGGPYAKIAIAENIRGKRDGEWYDKERLDWEVAIWGEGRVGNKVLATPSGQRVLLKGWIDGTYCYQTEAGENRVRMLITNPPVFEHVDNDANGDGNAAYGASGARTGHAGAGDRFADALDEHERRTPSQKYMRGDEPAATDIDDII